MASRRMISTTVFSSDKFMDLQPVTQLLYLQIGLNADDDGFTNRLNAIRKMVDATKENINELVDAGFIFIFNSGVAVDLYWNVNNSVRKDRYKPTVYQEEYALLTKDTEGRYILKPSDNQMDTNGIPSDNQMDTQVRLGKDRLGKYREKQPRARVREQTHTPDVVNEKSVDNFDEAEQYFTERIRKMITPEEGVKIMELVSKYGIDAFKAAVNIMQRRGGRSMRYLETVIKDPRPPSGGAPISDLTEEDISEILG